MKCWICALDDFAKKGAAMELHDLPQFTIERVRNPDNARLDGHLSQLNGVHVGSSWLYIADESLFGEFLEVDPATGAAVFWAPY